MTNIQIEKIVETLTNHGHKHMNGLKNTVSKTTTSYHGIMGQKLQ